MMAPSYFKPKSAEQMAALLVKVAKTVPKTPFYYYYIPMMNGLVHSVHQVLTLAQKEAPNVVGSKFTDSNLTDFSNCVEAGFNMLGGGDNVITHFMDEGGHGAIGVGFTCLGTMFSNIWDHHAAGRTK